MTTYYVSTSGNNGNSGTSTGAAWRTIQYAVENVVAGDTIRVLSGTYNERVMINDARYAVGNPAYELCSKACAEGTAASPITLMSHDSSNPAILSLKDGRSFNMLVLRNRSHWIIDGLKFYDFETGGIKVEAASQDVVGVYIQNCIIDKQNDKYRNWAHSIVFVGLEPVSVNYSYILNNYIGDVVTGLDIGRYNECITCQWSVHHILIQGNTVKNSFALTFDIISKKTQWGGGLSHHIIIDNNTVLSTKSDVGTNNAYKTDGADYILWQNNKAYNCDGFVTASEPWGDAYFLTKSRPYKNVVFRNNVLDTRGQPENNWGVLFGSDRFVANGTGNYGWVEKQYFVHNLVIVDKPAMPVIIWSIVLRARLKNNVLWQSGGGKDLHGQYGNIINAGYANEMTAEGWELDNNLYYTTNATPSFMWGDRRTYTSFAAYKAAHEPNSLFALPVLNSDYTLASTSPGYNAAQALTTATNSGSSSTSLQVRDAGYFCDGWGLIDADTITVGGTEVTIANVNYDTNVITLASAISWSAGAAVTYANAGSIGVFNGLSANLVADPVRASAGNDQTIVDTNDDGSASVTLVGTASTADNGIASYVWTRAGSTIATGANPTVTLGLGTHEITLTVTDTLGDTDTDTVIIRVISPGDVSNSTTVRNPCLSGFAGWLAHTNGSTTWEDAPSGSGVEITVTSDGGNTQLSQNGLIVQTGQVLTLRIVGEAIGVQQSFDVSLFKDTSPWTNYGLLETVTFETTETVIEREFVATADANDARLMAWFATGDNVIIREFNLLGPGENGCYNENSPGTVVSSGSLGVTSTDDYFSEAGGQFYENGNPSYVGDLRALYNNYDQFTGWIFVTDTAIPDGAEITSATLKVTAGGYRGALPKLRVDIENAADPSKPTTASDAAGRSWLTGSAWQSVAWTNTVQYTIDIDTAIVQSLIDAQGGIENGANIHVKLTDADVGFQVERLGDITTAAAELDIAWDAPAAGGTFAEEINPLRPGVRVGLKQGF